MRGGESARPHTASTGAWHGLPRRLAVGTSAHRAVMWRAVAAHATTVRGTSARVGTRVVIGESGPRSVGRLARHRLATAPRDAPFPPEVEKQLNTPIVFETYPLTVK